MKVLHCNYKFRDEQKRVLDWQRAKLIDVLEYITRAVLENIIEVLVALERVEELDEVHTAVT
jgi:hypothetical protein